ncbi:MAG: UDP-N-acetylmuramoyl-L-alanine--D-glutamate ligase [Chthoniobacteraceae bacterium]|nr:UDP-N-acetylmuramoyl-L-alanine--D-glutamate ligase [Chthoniobacteraceae bacterium]
MKPTYARQQIAVLGLGSSGEAAARRLLEEGACVTALDSGDSEKLRATAAALCAAGARVLLGAEADADPTVYDLGVLSPGIDPAVPLVRAFRAKGIAVIGELEFSYSLCACPVIAITGTNGKTTTTQLVERMLNACGVRTLAAGNIGPAFAARVRESANLDVMTLEVSSFQLEAIRTFRPSISVWLNFQADHLDRYASMEEYYAAKAHVFDYQSAEDVAIVKLEDKLPPLRARKITFSAYSQGGDLDLRDGVIHFHGKPVLRLADTQLRGLHNAENLMAALAVGAVRGLDFAAMTEALRTYKALPHRCEKVGTLDGVEYVNDSKATNLDALEKALLSENRRVVLIAGGKDKGFAFDSLTDLVASKARAVVLIGEMAARIDASWGGRVPCERAASLADAVAMARAKAQPGDVVLFSPGTSSFDMFKSYADRGNQFRGLVQSFLDSAL